VIALLPMPRWRWALGRNRIARLVQHIAIEPAPTSEGECARQPTTAPQNAIQGRFLGDPAAGEYVALCCQCLKALGTSPSRHWCSELCFATWQRAHHPVSA
jgi:hypothetical protein